MLVKFYDWGSEKMIKEIEMSLLPQKDDIVSLDGSDWKAFYSRFFPEKNYVIVWVYKQGVTEIE